MREGQQDKVYQRYLHELSFYMNAKLHWELRMHKLIWEVGEGFAETEISKVSEKIEDIKRSIEYIERELDDGERYIGG